MKNLIVTALLVGLFLNAPATDLSHLNDSIQKHRTGLIVIQTSPKTDVKVQQLKHEFWFGCALSGGPFDGRNSKEDSEMYKKKFLENFNSAVTANALKWRPMEREKGKVNFETVDNILAWTDENDIPLRGHNIYWGIHKFVPDWLKELDKEALNDEVYKRARTISARYAGRFAEYDLNNEMIHGNYFEDVLGADITREMAGWVKEYDPTAKLYLNDYDILTGNMLRPYVKHITDLLEMGVSIDGIGVQGHLHTDTFHTDSLQNALDMLAQFDLPIKVTEFNMPGQRSDYHRKKIKEMTPEAEEKKAKNLVDYYRICFAHPAVDGILMWGFWEGANWIPVSSLYKKDWTPTPAAEAYQSLIFDEWWTDFEGKSDKEGVCIIRAFYGTHKVMVNGKEVTVELKKESGTAYLQL